MPDYFTAKNGNLFIQPDGPNTPPIPLGCHDLGDIAEPLGDVSQRYYLDANGVYQPILESQGVPGRVTTSITTYLGSVRDELERIRCPFPLYVNRSTCGRKDIFLNYDRGSVLTKSRITNKTRTNNASREGTEASEQAFDLSAVKQNDYFPLTLAYQSSVETLLISDICFITDPTCAGSCGPAMDECSIGFMAAMGTAMASAFVYYTLNGGGTWTQCTAVPFGVNEHIMPCKCFYITRDTVRVIVGRGVTDAGNPAEIAYSDDFGTTWHLVNLGATVAACLPWVGSIFALDYRHIWAGTNLGALWFSDDGGVTWTLMFTATMGTNRIYSIRFRDETYGLIAGGSAGAGGLLYSTVDGGVTWLPLTAPVAMVAASIYACELIDKNRFWLGFGLNDGDLYYSNDAGVTWVHRNIVIPSPITSLDRVSEINFIDEQCVFVGITGSVGAVNYGCLFRSFDGGFSWESWVSPAMGALVGICGIHACSYNKCYWVGQPIAGLLGTVAIVSG